MGPLSFLQVNISGGESRDMQDNVTVVPTATVTLGNNGVSINGTAVYRDEGMNLWDICCQLTHFFQ